MGSYDLDVYTTTVLPLHVPYVDPEILEASYSLQGFLTYYLSHITWCIRTTCYDLHVLLMQALLFSFCNVITHIP